MTEMAAPRTILALETSCDETAAAVVRDGRVLLSNVVASQLDAHRRYGGVVPEVASRQHILSLAPVVEEALAVLPGGWQEVDAVAATYGPGLSGALLTGLNAAKAMAWQRGLPFIPVNHLEAHIYANWLDQAAEDAAGSAPPQFPLVALVVSGGHTLLALLRNHGDYELLGQTRDDAVGEAFDKVARILGLGYPGGPAVQQVAAGSGSGGSSLPRAWLRETYDFSFSGLKTAVLHRVQEQQEREQKVRTGRARSEVRRGKNAPPAAAESAAEAEPAALSSNFVAQMAYAFQESVVDVLTAKTVDAARRYAATEILLAGGVAANLRLREELRRRAADLPVRFPPIALCTDNAAMVAAAAFFRSSPQAPVDWGRDVVPSLPLGA